MVITTAVITPARPSRRQPIRFATATVDYSFDSTARAARDATLDEADAAIDGVLADYPAVQLHDRDEPRTQGDAGVDAGLRVFYGVFGLIVAIALFGIVNTLTLSIVERVHEVGLLRRSASTPLTSARWSAPRASSSPPSA